MICDKCNKNVDNGYSIVGDTFEENCCYPCAIRTMNTQITAQAARIEELEAELTKAQAVVEAAFNSICTRTDDNYCSDVFPDDKSKWCAFCLAFEIKEGKQV